MGIQVDPLYGSNLPDERFFLRFANLGNQSVVIHPGDRLFNIEFALIDDSIDREPIDKRDGQRGYMWKRITGLLESGQNPSWSYATRVQVATQKEIDRAWTALKSEVDHVRRGLEPLIMFGIFLVATTLLGTGFALLFAFQTTPLDVIPSWVPDWGWVMFAVVVSAASLATAAIGLATVWRFSIDMRRGSRSGQARRESANWDQGESL